MSQDRTIYIGELPLTSLGNVWVAVSEHGLVAVEFQTDQSTFTRHVLAVIGNTHAQILFDAQICKNALVQIAEYLIGERRGFELPIDWSVMKPFQSQALRLTCSVPYGETTTYKDIAARLGNPRAARAVGRAQATNPMPLVIPCHRVLGSDGKLHGNGAAIGLETKAWLLKLESTG